MFTLGPRDEILHQAMVARGFKWNHERQRYKLVTGPMRTYTYDYGDELLRHKFVFVYLEWCPALRDYIYAVKTVCATDFQKRAYVDCEDNQNSLLELVDEVVDPAYPPAYKEDEVARELRLSDPFLF
jgi:hypothetical protein